MKLVGMSRPPVMKVTATRQRVRSLMMARRAAKKVCSNQPVKIAVVLVMALAGLVSLTGCQGVSAGGNNQQQPTTLSLNTATLQFGSIQAGSNKTLTFTASNSGPSSISVSGVSISSKYFTLVSPSLPITVSSGQEVLVSVNFAPNAAGTFTATATVTSDASNPSITMSLSGTGTASSQSGDLASSPSSEAFGDVTIGSQESQTFTLTNNGSASVDISQVSITGTGFQLSGITTPLSLSSSQSTTFKVVFDPQTAAAASGSVTITSDASNSPLTVGLSGTGVTPGSLTANPASLSFGTVTVGSNSSLLETVTNTGGTVVAISQIGISGTGFTLSGVAATPITLASGQNTTFHVIFTPTSASTTSGTVTVTSNASNPSLSVSLSGTGTTVAGQLGVSPSTLAIGSVVVGTSGSGQGTLTATGASVTVNSGGTNNAAFSLSGLTLPVTIPAGQSVPFTVTFTPTAAGAVSASLSFTSNAQNSPTTETVTGTGEAAPTYDVSLSWTASTSQNISGYNIYRAVYTNSNCGSFAKINPSLNAATAYTDSTVADGTSYCYEATAVNSSNQESGPSNVVPNVQIPAP